MAQCIRPFTVKKTGYVVPCGKCPNCIKRRIAAWAFRLLQEYKISQSAYFLTLTYDTKYVPIDSSGRLVLSKRDVQLFFKRLRKAQAVSESEFSSRKLRYYAVGEYGTGKHRPHYHIILFDAELKLIDSAWNKGIVHYGKVNMKSIYYTLKYCCKPSKAPAKDMPPQFSLMSKGLGSSYLTKAMLTWHHSDLEKRMYCNLPDGIKISMPRYYKDKLYSKEEKLLIGSWIGKKMQAEEDLKLFKTFVDPFSIDEMIERFYNKESKNRKLC